MDLYINGKIAMVAASSQGIGFAVAEALANEGAIVSICSRNLENLKIAQRKLGSKHQAYVCNLQTEKDIEKWVDSTYNDLGPPSILVTNTGGPPVSTLDKTPISEWELGFKSILLSAVRLVDDLTSSPP